MDDAPDTLTVRVFRALIVAGAASALLWYALVWLVPGVYSQAASDALEWNGYEAVIPPTPVYPWLWLFLYVTSSVSLYRFSRASRLVFTALIFVSFVIGAASGLQVSTGTDSLFSGVMGYSIGGVLALAWTPPIRDRFRDRFSSSLSGLFEGESPRP